MRAAASAPPAPPPFRAAAACACLRARRRAPPSSAYAERAHPARRQGGGSVSVQKEVDPSLIAGLTITFGDKFIDMSVASQMKRLNALLMD